MPIAQRRHTERQSKATRMMSFHMKRRPRAKSTPTIKGVAGLLVVVSLLIRILYRNTLCCGSLCSCHRHKSATARRTRAYSVALSAGRRVEISALKTSHTVTTILVSGFRSMPINGYLWHYQRISSVHERENCNKHQCSLVGTCYSRVLVIT